MAQTLTRYTDVIEVVGDILKVRIAAAGSDSAAITPAIAYDDLALVEGIGGFRSLARVIKIDRDVVALQVCGARESTLCPIAGRDRRNGGRRDGDADAGRERSRGARARS
jgi:hypothetical protein